VIASASGTLRGRRGWLLVAAFAGLIGVLAAVLVAQHRDPHGPVHIVKSTSKRSCSGYASDDRPPATIRVLRYAAHDANGWGSQPRQVVTVPFKDYVRDAVLAEWIPSWDEAALETGAIAIKTYAWYWVNHYGGFFRTKSNCFDVTDDIAFQRYVPGSSREAGVRAVNKTWSVLAKRSGKVFQASYRAYIRAPRESCGVETDGKTLSQWGSQACAEAGMSAAAILRTYYPDVQLSTAR
jgi:peptidoglycan hydrolase-like amidase